MKSLRFICLFFAVIVWPLLGLAQPAFLTNGLLAYYPFNKNLVDASGNLHNGASNGTGLSFSTDRYGSSNAAAHFAGGGYLSFTPTPFNVNTDYTLTFWVKLDAGGSVDNFFSTQQDTLGGMNMRVVRNNNPIGWAFVPKGPDGIDSFPPTNYFVWHAFVCVRQSTNDFMYIDGSLMASGNHSGTTADTGSLWIGRHQSSFNYDLHGAIDDIRIYDRAFSASEAAQLFAFETAGLARTATAIGRITNGFFIGATITDTGFGYTNAPSVRLIGGGGSGGQALATVSNGIVTAVNASSAGSNYTSAPLIVIEPPFIPNPLLAISPLSYLTFSNLTTGSNYQLQSFRSNVWVNESLSFVASNSVFAQFFPGFLNSSNFRLALKPAPSQAVATPQIANGFLIGATITNGGAGYLTSPVVTITDAAGSNAMATAQVGGGMVTNIFISNAGFGYTGNASLTIAPPPPGIGIAPDVQAGMRLDSSKLSPYDNYQLQTTQVLGGPWSNYSANLITSTNTTNSQSFFISNNVSFFRLQFVP